MTAHVTIESFRNPETDWRGRPLGRIGDAVTVVVKLWDYANLKGGRFSIKHPAMAPEGEEFEIPKRRATGDRKVLGVVGKHKTTPEDLSHEDTIDCVVHLTQACDGYEPFTLTALENCVTEPAPEATLRCVATQTLFDAARVIVRSGVRDNTEERYDVARAGNKGLPSTIGNTIRACVRLFATLRFKDPDGDERPFPKGTPVKVLLGDHPDHAIDAALGDDGKLSLEVIGHASVLSAKTLTLRLGADSKNRVICELPGDPKSQKRGSEPAETDPTGTRDARFFTLPREWSLREADWVVTDDDGRWVADPAHFKMTVNGRAASLGKVDAPVKLVLDPHWQFLKFEFFDRRYGHSDHADKPKTLPPMVIEGFRYKPTSSSTKPDVRSNWWVVDGDDALQCVPWILQRNPNGTERKRPSGQTLLRFSLPPKTCVHSESATKRTRVIATDEQWKPGPTRLDFYDLPEAWNSRNYYARLSASPHEFGWYEQVASKPSSKAKPLTFSLDDIVLTDEGGKRIAAWTHDDRLAIFAHTFDDTLANTSKEGVYKPDDPGKTPWYSKKPASGAPEENENYVVDHPGWTRLIAAQGNLFDVFDRRTVASSPPDLDYDVIGARAAVCWVDTTKQIGAATLWEPDPSDPDYEQESADHRPSPGRYFKGAGTPAMSDHGSMAVQPYYSQDYMDRFGKYLDAGTTGSIGRFDMALLRCCGVADVDGKPTELALNLWFHRLCFDATIAPVGMAIDAYQVAFVRNVLDRFNGLDAKNNQKRAELLPKDASKPLKVSVMTFMQVTPEAEAHFRIVLTDSSADARDWRSGHDGTGETANSAPQDSGDTNGFVNAHEHGHQSALPDEYNERWDAASYGQPSFFSTLPGDPFELDGRTKEFQEDNSPLMNGNHTLHNRYFWQAAEWVRLVVRTGMKVKLGTKYADYWLPPYEATQEAKRHFAFWPLNPSANDVALPVRAPLTANRGKVDLYLYAIGADAFAVKTLPSREDPPASDPYDGILMVTVRLKVQAWGVRYEDEKDLKKLAQAIALAPRRLDAPQPRKLNHSWIFKGTHGKGTPQEWAFKRCLVHFSPRLVVSGVTELEKVDDWEARVDEFKTETIWTDAKTKLTDYHAIDWDDPAKATRLDTLIGPAAEPTITVRGGWNITHATVNAINGSLSQYEGLPADQVRDRYSSVKSIVDGCDQWLALPNTQTSNGRGVVTALRGRAEDARKKLGALFYVRDLESKAKELKKRNGKQEKKVTKVTTEHAPHFTVTCKTGTPTKAEWDPLPLEGDLPAVATWEALVPQAQRTGAVFNRIKGLLTKYKSKDALDLPGRITALSDMIAPAVIAPEPSPRGTWTTRAKASLTIIDTQLSAFEAADPENHDLRQESVVGAQAIAVAVPDMDGTDGTDATDAAALVTRTDATIDLLRFRRQVRSLEAHAARFKAHLDRWVSSTTCTLTADSPGGFEEAFLLAFPSMIGAYKSASKIEVADIRAIVSSLTVDDLRVVDLLDS